VDLKGGAEVAKLVVPVLPGDYELRYRAVRGDSTVVLRQPFRSVLPKLTIEAPATAAANGSIDFRILGDIGEFMTLTVVPAGTPDKALGPHTALKQGSEETGSIRLYNTEPGKYEIRCISNSGYGTQVYARRALTIR
jgi:hypothetical protein